MQSFHNWHIDTGDQMRHTQKIYKDILGRFKIVTYNRLKNSMTCYIHAH